MPQNGAILHNNGDRDTSTVALGVNYHGCTFCYASLADNTSQNFDGFPGDGWPITGLAYRYQTNPGKSPYDPLGSYYPVPPYVFPGYLDTVVPAYIGDFYVFEFDWAVLPGTGTLAAVHAYDFGGFTYYPDLDLDGTPWSSNGIADYAVLNLTLVSFSSTATTATSVVEVTSHPGLRITRHVSVSPANSSVFVSEVTIDNKTASTVTMRYKRGFDFDVPPTQYNEYVKFVGGNALRTAVQDPYASISAHGFDSPGTTIAEVGPYVADAALHGPLDYGATYAMQLPSLAPGKKFRFYEYHGAAATAATLESAFQEAGAIAYCIGMHAAGEYPNYSPGENDVSFGYGFSGFAEVIEEGVGQAKVCAEVAVLSAQVEQTGASACIELANGGAISVDF